MEARGEGGGGGRRRGGKGEALRMRKMTRMSRAKWMGGGVNTKRTRVTAPSPPRSPTVPPIYPPARLQPCRSFGHIPPSLHSSPFHLSPAPQKRRMLR
eukprot:4986367-Pyramimonas_sp.AAC.1